MPEVTIEALAGRLDRALADRRQTSLFTPTHPGMTLDDGYAIQRAWTRARMAAGHRPIGYKIGLTSRATQRALNVGEPGYGLLFDDMLLANGQDVSFDRFIVPRIEVELAFRLKQPLEGPDCTIFDVLAATDYLVPAIEIIDARIEQADQASGATRGLPETIADNLASAALVLGGRPVRSDAIDPRWVAALLHRNGAIEESGV